MFCATKRSMLLPMCNDSFGENLADAWKLFEFSGRGCVDVDRRGAFVLAWCSRCHDVRCILRREVSWQSGAGSYDCKHAKSDKCKGGFAHGRSCLIYANKCS